VKKKVDEKVVMTVVYLAVLKAMKRELRLELS